MMEPAVEMSPQSFVTKTLGFFMKLTVTRFVSFCPTWLRTCEVWSISLIFTVEEKTLIFCAAPLTQPLKVTSMDESASQAPPSHSTSFFSSVTINSQPLWLYYFPISFPLLFLSFPPLLQSLPVSSWFSPSSTLTPRFTLSSITRRLYFLKLRGKRQQGDPRHHGKLAENPTLTSILSSPLTLFLVAEKNFKEPWERQGSGRLVSIRGHSEILEHQPSLKQCQSVTENQSRERHDGYFLLQSVTVFTPNWLDVP